MWEARVSNNPLQRNKAATPSAQEVQIGGPGNDVFHVDDSGEVVLDSSSADRDVVYASVNWVMTGGSHIEVLSAVSTSATTPLQLSGNEFNQEVYGNAGANFLDGGGGTDYLFGFGGDDTYLVRGPADHVFENAGGGRDVVYSLNNYTLEAGVEIEVLSTSNQSGTAPLVLIGNSLGQEIYGNAGANFLDGGGGTDYLFGFGGDDTYLVRGAGDHVFEAVGGGRDIVYALANYTLEASAQIEILSASDQSGTTPLVLIGNGFDQEIYGNAGDNFLQGGGGTDYLIGLGGNDTYFITGPGDNVVESAGGGTRDIIYTPGDYTMIGGVEVEVLASSNQAGTNAQTLIGNNLGQEIYGNNGANFILGGGGADYLSGLGGNDTYVVDSMDDYVAESAGGGSDVVYAQASYALAAGQEIEVLSTASTSGTGAINLTGNDLANQLYGNNGANVLNGGAGADYLQGFGGADSFQFTTALGNGNVDQIADFTSGTDKIVLDDAVFTQLSLGALPASVFTTGAAATNEDQRIIYDSATGNLYYDSDGNGGAAAVLFATLNGHPPLTASDFLVI